MGGGVPKTYEGQLQRVVAAAAAAATDGDHAEALGVLLGAAHNWTAAGWRALWCKWPPNTAATD